LAEAARNSTIDKKKNILAKLFITFSIPTTDFERAKLSPAKRKQTVKEEGVEKLEREKFVQKSERKSVSA